jgi:L-serine dehydratase
MRGPSSSHTAAAHRIGTIIRQLCTNSLSKVRVEFDKYGALATTYLSQGSAMGLAGGLLGIDIIDQRLIQYEQILKEKNLEIEYVVNDNKADHPSTYNVFFNNGIKSDFQLIAISTGGGMFEIKSIEGFEVSIKGDYFESLFLFSSLSINDKTDLEEKIQKKYNSAKIYFGRDNRNNILLNVKNRESIFSDINALIGCRNDILWKYDISPVLPVLSGNNNPLPFRNYSEMMDFAKDKNISLAELAVQYESARSGLSTSEVFSKMKDLVIITKNSISEGLNGTSYNDRILGQQSHLIKQAEKAGKLFPSANNSIIAFTSALMEVKSSMGIIIAAPTAGSCGVLGGAIMGANGELNADLDNFTKAFLAAGLIGVFIAAEYTFSAEEGGCQVECGAASSMAAAGLVELMGGSHIQAVNAASMALQNLLGLICDPVGCRVEVPCLGKNILGATNALNAANMTLAGFNHLIPLNEVIDAMKAVGSSLHSSLRCTGLGGLAQTPKGKEILIRYNSL